MNEFPFPFCYVKNGGSITNHSHHTKQNRGTLLDNPSAETLENPERHTVHCLIDVGICNGSPFHILTDPRPDNAPNAYGPGKLASFRFASEQIQKKLGLKLSSKCVVSCVIPNSWHGVSRLTIVGFHQFCSFFFHSCSLQDGLSVITPC